MLAREYGMGGPTLRARPRWGARGFGTGIAVSLPLLAAVALVAAVPDLELGHPLVLLPLLAAGPLAGCGLRPPWALVAVVLAGLTSAVLTAGGLAIGSQLLGASVWTLTAAASA